MTSSEQSDTKTLPQSSVHIRDVKVLIVAINMAEIPFCVPIQEVSVLPEPRPVCTAQLQRRATINPVNDSLTPQLFGFEALGYKVDWGLWADWLSLPLVATGPQLAMTTTARAGRQHSHVLLILVLRRKTIFDLRWK